MNVGLVCAAMPIAPLLTYFIMSLAGVTSIYKVLVPEIFVILYIVLIVIVMIRRVESEERAKTKTA